MPGFLRRALSGLPSAARADVQALVGQWHGQHTMRALRYPPQVLVLRIARYNQAASGAVGKNHCVITWSRFLSVPAFLDDSLNTTLLQYRIGAATYHVGPLLTSGHYTCSLIAADQAWYCDDGVQPTPECEARFGQWQFSFTLSSSGAFASEGKGMTFL